MNNHSVKAPQIEGQRGERRVLRSFSISATVLRVPGVPWDLEMLSTCRRAWLSEAGTPAYQLVCQPHADHRPTRGPCPGAGSASGPHRSQGAIGQDTVIRRVVASPRDAGSSETHSFRMPSWVDLEI